MASRPAPVVETAAPAPARPGLIISDDAPPEVVYKPGSHDAAFSGTDEGMAVRRSIPPINTSHIETPVTAKAVALSRELDQLRNSTQASSDQLLRLQAKNDAGAADYYAVVASINTELQSGTTPGNPILVDRWKAAQDKLNALSDDSSLLNGLATDLSNQASQATYLLDATQTAFSLSGAVQEDHQKLTVVEDGLDQQIALINRLLIKTNDEISRRTTYLRAERSNLQTLSLGIANGELYGQSLTNSLFRKATGGSQGVYEGPASPAVAGRRKPLVIIRFDRPTVNFEQPLYTAVSQALEKYPSAKFDLVAVSNMEGNAAQLALSSAEARKNGEMVLRSLSNMGVPMERIRLSAANSKDVLNSEVHLYLQ
jgi:hypothetical protein